MVRHSAHVLVGFAFVLGCAAAKPTDETGTVSGVAQSDVCVDYLACAAAVDAEDFPTLTATYGPTGDCWASTQEFADTCTGVCQSAVEALALEYPEDPACSDYAPTSGPVDDGSWSLSLTVSEKNGCGVRDAVWEWLGTSATNFARGTFTWDIDDRAAGYRDDVALACTFTLLDFACAGDQSGGQFTMELDGSGTYTAATGTWRVYLDTECESTGQFTASLLEGQM